MAAVYSERFFSRRGANPSANFVVPPGMRAVVRHFSFIPWTVSGQDVVLRCAFVPLVYKMADAPNVTSHWDLRFTVYAGEHIECSATGADCSFACDGFLFPDPTGKFMGASAEVHELEQDELFLPGGTRP